MSAYKFEYKVEYSLHPTDKNKILVRPTITAHRSLDSSTSHHTIFVIDNSVSMSGKKIAVVKQAVLEFIKNHIKINNTFSVITFNRTATVKLNNVRKEAQLSRNVIDTINQISTDSGTAIEAGLSLIGSDIKVLDEQCSIILLTDGENSNPISAQDEIEKLTNRCKGIRSRIIPMGIGVEYNLPFLRRFGELTGINAVIHIKDEQDISQAFNICKELTGERTPTITLSTVLDSRKSQVIGSLAPQSSSGWVFEFDKGNSPEINLSVSINVVNERAQLFRKQLKDVASNREVIAHYSNQLLSVALQNHHNARDEIPTLLSLLFPPRNDDSEFVRITRANIQLALDAANKNDINSMRQAASRSYLSSSGISMASVASPGMMSNELLNVLPANNQVPVVTKPINVLQTLKTITDVVCVNYFNHNNFNASPAFITLIPTAEESIYIDQGSPLVLELFQEIQPTSTEPEHFIQLVIEKIKNTFLNLPAEETIKLLKAINKDPNNNITPSYYKTTTTISLDTYIKNKIGFSYHITALATLLLALLEKQLGEKETSKRKSTIDQRCESFMKIGDHYPFPNDGNLCPSWISYTVNNRIYFIDPMQGIWSHTTDELSHQLNICFEEKDKQITTHFKHEEKQDFCFNEQEIPDIFLELVNPNASVNQQFICPLSKDVMKMPVRIAGDPDNYVFDRESLKVWHGSPYSKIDKTNPETNQRCSTIYIPAIDVKQQIIAKAAENFGRIKKAIETEDRGREFENKSMNMSLKKTDQLRDIANCKRVHLIINQHDFWAAQCPQLDLSIAPHMQSPTQQRKPHGFDEIARILNANVSPRIKAVQLARFAEETLKVITAVEINTIDFKKVHDILNGKIPENQQINELKSIVNTILEKNKKAKQDAEAHEKVKQSFSPMTLQFYQVLKELGNRIDYMPCDFLLEIEKSKSASTNANVTNALMPQASSTPGTFYHASNRTMLESTSNIPVAEAKK